MTGTLRSASGLALTAAAVLAGVAAVVAAVRRRRGGSAEPDGRRRALCRCGQPFEVTGLDRHRVFWLRDEPVLGDECPACGRPLQVSSP